MKGITKKTTARNLFITFGTSFAYKYPRFVRDVRAAYGFMRGDIRGGLEGFFKMLVVEV